MYTMKNIWSNGLERSQLVTQWVKLGQMVLKAVIREHNGLERSQFGTQSKSSHMVLKGVNWVHTEYNHQVKWS